MPAPARPTTAFGKALVAAMKATGRGFVDIRNTGLMSPQYVSHLLHGRVRPSPRKVKQLCAALQLPRDLRAELHRAGARANGWEI